LATFGVFSLWVLPAVYGCTISHNITLIALSSRERKKPLETRNGALSATSKKASIICTWILVLLWTTATGMVPAFAIVFSEDGYELRYYYIIPWFEFSFAMMEVVVMGFLGVQCVRERRQIIGLAHAAKWYHLGSYNLEGGRG
jgi:hypothetical protein